MLKLFFKIYLNRVSKKTNRIVYSQLSDGGVVDDVLVYKLHDEKFLVVANAANWMRTMNGFR